MVARAIMHTRFPLPFRITLLAFLVLTTTAWNAVRMITSFTWRAAIQTYAPYPGTVYIGLTGAMWTLVGLSVFWGIWQRAAWALRGALIAASAYSIWLWMDRFLIQARVPGNWPFALLANFVVLGFITAVTLDRRNQAHFGKEAHERDFQN